jgi:hypothetical protein
MAYIADIATVLAHFCISVSDSNRCDKIRYYRIIGPLQNDTNAALNRSHTAPLFLLCTSENV